MPTCPIVTDVRIDGKPLEPVGAGFDRALLTDQLRGKRGFGGLIRSDWAITNDCPERCRAPTTEAPQRITETGMPWGVETLSPQQRFALGANAGVDRFGGVSDPEPLHAAVAAGELSDADCVRTPAILLIHKIREETQ